MKTGRIKRSRKVRLFGAGILLALLFAGLIRAAAYTEDTEAEIRQEQAMEDRTGQTQTDWEQTRLQSDEKQTGQQTEQQQTEQQQAGTYPEISQKTEAESEYIPQTEEPKGYYTVILKDIHADIPKEGRIYDGTDRIQLAFSTDIEKVGEEEEKIPDYMVICNARLDGCGAGERKVLYSFSLQTSFPDHIKIAEDQEYPELTVDVRKAVLSVRIADGTKKYMAPADTEHILFSSDPAVTVSGFVKNADGDEVIPSGFRAPEVAVDSTVLKKNSPIYEPVRKDTGNDKDDQPEMKICLYESALILKREPDGKLTGEPTGNYEFCSDIEDERYHPGTVIVTGGEILYGEDYSIDGENGAYLITGQNEVIVREGTSLNVKPVKGSGYNTGASSGTLTGEGIFSFRLRKQDSSGRTRADSEVTEIRYISDAAAPEAVLSVSGASGNGSLLYSASSVSAAASVSSDDMSGISSTRCRILKGNLNAENLRTVETSGPASVLAAGAWKDTSASEIILLNEEGIFQIEYEVTDGVGNRNRTVSSVIVIDHTAPTVTIEGVSDGSANAGALVISASCLDAAYSTGSMSAEMSAASGGLIPDMTVISEGPQGALVSYADFAYSRQADAVYTLRVSAKDLAGNETVRTVSFSVNRFGSAYCLGTDTEEMLRSYYHRQSFPVVFKETNLDSVPNARVFIRQDSSLRELTLGDGLLTRKGKKKRGVNCYTYTVSSEAFREDGRYEVLLLTSDEAGNSSDSEAQDLPVRFAVDSTAPQCLVTGIRDGEKYQTEKLTAVIQVKDNIRLSEARIYKDSILWQIRDEEQLLQTDGIIKLLLDEKESWQTLQICVADCAGNECWTQQLSFLVSSRADEGNIPSAGLRITARQLSQASRWLKVLRERILEAAAQNSPDNTAQEIRLLLERKKPVSDPAESLRVYESQISAEQLRSRRLKNLLTAAAVILMIPLLYILIRNHLRSAQG